RCKVKSRKQAIASGLSKASVGSENIRAARRKRSSPRCTQEGQKGAAQAPLRSRTGARPGSASNPGRAPVLVALVLVDEHVRHFFKPHLMAIPRLCVAGSRSA